MLLVGSCTNNGCYVFVQERGVPGTLGIMYCEEYILYKYFLSESMKPGYLKIEVAK